MADQKIPTGARASDEPLFHNPVLMRTREPAASYTWVAPSLAGLTALIAVLVIAYMQAHPSKPLINHAVATAPPSASQPGAT